MLDATAKPRSALLAGSTGLVGRELLALLLESRDYATVHALVRRTSPHIDAAPRLRIHEVDFAQLPVLPPVDDVFIALGTTIKAAGSLAAFRQVDFDCVVNVARIARAQGASRLGVVSAMGANAASRVFYSRVKGEMETEIVRLGYDAVVIAQPSLLLGDRAALGQPARRGELWAARLFGPLAFVVPRDLRPIPSRAVAAALLAGVRDARSGVRVLKSAEIRTYL